MIIITLSLAQFADVFNYPQKMIQDGVIITGGNQNYR